MDHRQDLHSLPAEVVGACLAYLGPKEVAAVATASKDLFAYSQSDILWRALAPQLGMPLDESSTADEIKFDAAASYRWASGQFDAAQILARTAGYNRRFHSSMDLLPQGNTALIAAGLTSGDLSIFKVTADPSSAVPSLRLQPRCLSRVQSLHDGLCTTVCLQQSADGGTVYCLTGGEDGRLFLLDGVQKDGAAGASSIARHEIRRPLDQLGNVGAIVASASHADFSSTPLFAVSDDFGRIEFIEASRPSSASVVMRINAHYKTCSCLAFAPATSVVGPNALASGGFDGRLVLTDVRSPSTVACWSLKPPAPTSDDAGSWVNEADGQRRLMSLREGLAAQSWLPVLHTLLTPSSPCYRVYDVAFNAGSLLAAACGEGLVRLFDLRQPQRVLQTINPADTAAQANAMGSALPPHRPQIHRQSISRHQPPPAPQRPSPMSTGAGPALNSFPSPANFQASLSPIPQPYWAKTLAFASSSCGDESFSPCLLVGGGDHIVRAFSTTGALKLSAMAPQAALAAAAGVPVRGMSRRPSASSLHRIASRNSVTAAAGAGFRSPSSPSLTPSSSEHSLASLTSHAGPMPGALPSALVDAALRPVRSRSVASASPAASTGPGPAPGTPSPGKVFASLLHRIASSASVARDESGTAAPSPRHARRRMASSSSSSAASSAASAWSPTSSPLSSSSSSPVAAIGLGAGSSSTFDFAELPPPPPTASPMAFLPLGPLTMSTGFSTIAGAAPPGIPLGPSRSSSSPSSFVPNRKKAFSAPTSPISKGFVSSLPPPPLAPAPIIPCRYAGIVDVHSGPVLMLRRRGPWCVSISSDESMVVRREDQMEDAPWRWGQGLRDRILGPADEEGAAGASESGIRQAQDEMRRRTALVELFAKRRHQPMPYAQSKGGDHDHSLGEDKASAYPRYTSHLAIASGVPHNPSVMASAQVAAAALKFKSSPSSQPCGPAVTACESTATASAPPPRLAGGGRAVILPPFKLHSTAWSQEGSMAAHLRTLLAASLASQ